VNQDQTDDVRKAYEEMNSHDVPSSFASVFKQIEGVLMCEKHRIGEEIKHYPTPITVCDAQFNYLLEERSKIAQELDLWETLATEEQKSSATLRRIRDFIKSTRYIDDEYREAVLSLLAEPVP
jgi:hypothetical protein